MSLTTPRRAGLEPGQRISEALFGLIMVLTFTGSLSVADAGRDDVRTMLIGALGCNLAWGIIDGILYLMDCLGEQGRGIRALRQLQQAGHAEGAHQAIASVLPTLMAETLGPAEYEPMRRKLVQLPPPPDRPRLSRQDWLGALAVFLWVNAMTLPVALPFLFVDHVLRAMRISNAIAVTLLFIAGYAYGRQTEHRPWLMGLAMVLLGGVLVAITIALGG